MKCKSMKYNIISTLFIIFLFSGALFAGFYFKNKGETSPEYFFGFAAGLLLVAVFNSIRMLKMKKNPKYKKEQEIAQTDERLISLRNRSTAVAFFVLVISCAALSVISAVEGDMEKASDFSLVICIGTAVHFISYLILSHKE